MLVKLKQSVIEQHVARQVPTLQAAKLLAMHPKAFLRLKGRFLIHGVAALIPKKPGPKQGQKVVNRTKEEVERVVLVLEKHHPLLGPVPLAELLRDLHGITLHPTTIWRILRRSESRYTNHERRWKQKPKLYALEEPGAEVQMDACFPFGRSKKLAVFDAVDDCSRFLTAKTYEREDYPSAKDFLCHLVKTAPFPIQSVRLDNRFRGARLKKVAEKLGVSLIFNEPYHPEQNGKVERYHRTFRREAVYKTIGFQDSPEETAYKLSLWVNHYNHVRRHGGLGMQRMTPAQKLGAVYLAKSLTFPQPVTRTLQQYIC